MICKKCKINYPEGTVKTFIMVNWLTHLCPICVLSIMGKKLEEPMFTSPQNRESLALAIQYREQIKAKTN